MYNNDTVIKIWVDNIDGFNTKLYLTQGTPGAQTNIVLSPDKAFDYRSMILICVAKSSVI